MKEMASEQKEQRRKALREWRRKNPDKVRAQQKRSYAKRYADPVKRARFLSQCSESRKRHKEQRVEYDKKREKTKLHARQAIRDRVYMGILMRKPCEVCGKPDAHAHHDNYAEWLSVKWLCPEHHVREHKNV